MNIGGHFRHWDVADAEARAEAMAWRGQDEQARSPHPVAPAGEGKKEMRQPPIDPWPPPSTAKLIACS
jgi:hypothetical protein